MSVYPLKPFRNGSMSPYLSEPEPNTSAATQPADTAFTRRVAGPPAPVAEMVLEAAAGPHRVGC